MRGAGMPRGRRCPSRRWTRSAGTTPSCSAPSATRASSGVLERGLLLKLRFELDHYVNLRPSKLSPACRRRSRNPGEIDFVVVREGTEGPYVGNGGAIRVGTPQEVATEVS